MVAALGATAAVPAFGASAAGNNTTTLTMHALKGDIPTADPALASDTTSGQLASETFTTLVRGDEQDLSKILPGMATKWDVSDDKLTYTFHLRNNIPWVKWDTSLNKVVELTDSSGNPLMVNAHDFEYGIKRVVDPRTGSNYTTGDDEVIAGANDLTSYTAPVPASGTPDPNATMDPAALQKLSDAVGVKATDDWTLQVKVAKPYAFALGVLGFQVNTAIPQSVVEKYGDKWTEPGNAWSYGPYVISDWKHSASMTLVANPFWPDLKADNMPKPSITTINWLMIDDTPAFTDYLQGTNDVDTPIPLEQIDRIKADPKLSKELFIGPSYCTYYYGFNVTKAPVDDARVRLALSEAIDRASIVKNVTKGGQVPARWMGRPGLAFAPTPDNWPEGGVGYDVADAKKQLQSYLDEKKITVDKLPQITLGLNQSAGHVNIAQAIQQMWQTSLGIKVQLQTQEWKVYLNTLTKDAPQVFRLGWCQDYNDESDFIVETFTTGQPQNSGKYSNPAFDKLAAEAAVEQDPAKRLDDYKSLETTLVKTDAAIAPIYWYTALELTKPYVHRTNGLDTQRWEKWTMDPH